MTIPDDQAIADLVESALYLCGEEEVYVEEDARTEPPVLRIVLTVDGRTVHLPILDGEGPAA